jgi:hypothetical protein
MSVALETIPVLVEKESSVVPCQTDEIVCIGL